MLVRECHFQFVWVFKSVFYKKMRDHNHWRQMQYLQQLEVFQGVKMDKIAQSRILDHIPGSIPLPLKQKLILIVVKLPISLLLHRKDEEAFLFFPRFETQGQGREERNYSVDFVEIQGGFAAEVGAAGAFLKS